MICLSVTLDLFVTAPLLREAISLSVEYRMIV